MAAGSLDWAADRDGPRSATQGRVRSGSRVAEFRQRKVDLA